MRATKKKNLGNKGNFLEFLYFPEFPDFLFTKEPAYHPGECQRQE